MIPISKRRGVHWVPMVSGLILAACAGSPVQSYKGAHAQVRPGQSFRWISQEDARQLKLNNPNVTQVSMPVRIEDHSDVDQKVRPVVENALKKAGYVLASNSEPDLYVTFYAKGKSQNWLSSWNGVTPGLDNVPFVISPDFERQTLRNSRDGDVYLVFYPRGSQNPVWVGVDSKLKDAPAITQPDLVAAVDRLTAELSKSG